MRIEHELLSYKATWQGKPQSEVVDGICSFAMESNRIPDPYFFEVNSEGKLIDPETKKEVEESILKRPPPYDKEYEGFTFIQDWVNQSTSGVIVWISPPYPGFYPFSKVVVSEIQSSGSQKRLLNRAIVLEAKEKNCVSFANELVIYSSLEKYFTDNEELRSQPIALDQLNKDEWQTIILHILKDKISWEFIEKGKDIKLKETSRPKAERIYDKLFSGNPYYWTTEEQKELLSIFGQKAGTCPPASKQKGAFNTLFENSITNESSFNCPNCNKAIPSGLGITKCPHCGITKEEWGSICD